MKFSPIICLLQLFILFFSGFTQANQNISSPQKLEKVSLQLKWKHQFQFAGYYAAKAQGFYQQAGVDVSFIEASPSIQPIKQVTSGQSQYGVGDIGIIAHYANGQPIRVLAAIFQHNPLVFISKQSSGIISPYEMAGKRIMIDTQSGDDAPLTALLVESDLTQKHYTAIAPSFSINELINDQVDVVPLLTSNFNFIINLLLV